MIKLEQEIYNDQIRYYFTIPDTQLSLFYNNNEYDDLFTFNNIHIKYGNSTDDERLLIKDNNKKYIFENNVLNNGDIKYLNNDSSFLNTKLTNQNEYISLFIDSFNEYLRTHILKIFKSKNLGIIDISVDSIFYCVYFRKYQEPFKKLNTTYKFIVNEKFNDILKYQLNEDELIKSIDFILFVAVQSMFHHVPTYNIAKYFDNLNNNYSLDLFIYGYLRHKISKHIKKDTFTHMLYKNCLKNKLYV